MSLFSGFSTFDYDALSVEDLKTLIQMHDKLYATMQRASQVSDADERGQELGML